MSKPSFLSIGEVLWDRFPDGPRFGGAPANFACHAAALGGRVSMVSAVGDDERGRDGEEILRSYRVDTSLVQHVAKIPTGAVEVVLDTAGKPTFTILTNSAWDHIEWTAELEERASQVDAIYFGTLGQRSEVTRKTTQRLLGLAKSRGILRVLDVNLRKPFFNNEIIRESIALANVVKLSDDEMPVVAKTCGIDVNDGIEQTMQSFLEKNRLDLVAMTRGAEGAILVSRTKTISQSAIPTVVRDTVGAGDAFTAALAIGLLRSDSLTTIARFACETAAATCAHSGAVPELRTKTQGI